MKKTSNSLIWTAVVKSSSILYVRLKYIIDKGPKLLVNHEQG